MPSDKWNWTCFVAWGVFQCQCSQWVPWVCVQVKRNAMATSPPAACHSRDIDISTTTTRYCFHRRLHPAAKASRESAQNTKHLCAKQRQAGKGNNSAVSGDTRLIARLPVAYCLPSLPSQLTSLHSTAAAAAAAFLRCHSQGCTCALHITAHN